ncbi:MAG: hypothetical protein KDC71_02530 [Acidobacteria bacterium]|nr:hypothetical protein [Acidobacteriota bacterium]
MKRSSQKKEPIWQQHLFWICVLGAFSIRICFLLSNQDRAWPFSIFYYGDSRHFYEQALNVLTGKQLENGIPFHPPAFPVVLAGLYRLVGANIETGAVSHLAVKVFLALINSFSVGFLAQTLKPFFNPRIIVISCTLFTLHFGYSVLAIAPVSEGLYLTLLMFCLWQTAQFWSNRAAPPYAQEILRCLVLGTLPLLRAESLFWVTGLWILPWIPVLRSKQFRRALVSMVFFLPVGFWTLRNYQSLHRINQTQSYSEPLPQWVPLTLYGPLNLALANHPGADGRFSPSLLSASDHLDLNNPQHLELLLHGQKPALHFIGNHPIDFLNLVLNKWALTLRVFNLGYGQTNFPNGLTGIRNPVDIFVGNKGWGLLSLPLFFWGIWQTRKNPKTKQWFAFTIFQSLYFLAITAFFFGYTRQGLLFFWAWLPFLAISLDKALDWLQRWIPAKITVWTIAAIVLCLSLWGTFSTRNFRASGPTLPNGKLNPDAEIQLEILE